jgi:two-component system sensor histidine kinase AtoS
MVAGPKISRKELLKIKDYIASIVVEAVKGAILFDLEGKIAQISDGLAEVLGLKQKDIVGQSCSEVFLEDDVPFEIDRLAALIKEGEAGQCNFQYLAKDGRKIPLQLRASAIKDQDGQIIFILCVLDDSTTGKETEEILDRAFTRFKQTQDRVTQVEKIEIVKKLGLGVAHEVKNPLAIILQCVDYLNKKIKTDDKNISLAFKHIKDAVTRVDSVSKGLLDLCRLTDVNKTENDLNSIIEKALFLMKHQFDKNNIQITKDLDKSISPIIIDKDKIEQVIVNLLTNSLAAMPEGGNITVRSLKPEPKREEILAIVEIEDTGEGIPLHLLAKIFDPFVSTRHETGCTGLGLSVVRDIIELHGGRISIQNKKDCGVKVTLVFKS